MNTMREKVSIHFTKTFLSISTCVEAVKCECSGLRRTVNDIVWSECLHNLESFMTSTESPPLAHSTHFLTSAIKSTIEDIGFK